MGSFFDPTTVVQGQVAGWASQATGWAQHIYFTLLIFELVALGISTLLFRENLGEFFASFSLKVFLGGIYFWFINNAAGGVQWPEAVIRTFQQFGINLGGSTNTAWLAGEGLTAAAAYFGAGLVNHTVDTGAAQIVNLPPNCTVVGAFTGIYGYCDIAPIIGAQSEGVPFAMITQAMALMIVMALFAVWLQFILVTIESYLVMGCGILFIGFAGSRFTLPFSQGYFSYMINVGVKFMVMYIILGILSAMMPAILTSAGATLLASFLPGGEYVALVPAAVGLLNLVVGAALIWTIPGFCGSFLSGQSSASGSAALGQAIGSMAGASAMMAQFKSAANTQNGAQSNAAPSSANANNFGAYSHNNGAAEVTQQHMSPTANGQSFSHAAPNYSAPFNPNSATSIGINTGGGMQYGYMQQSGSSLSDASSTASAGSPYAPQLSQMSPQQIGAMESNIPLFKSAVARGDLKDLDQAQFAEIRSNAALRNAAGEVLGDQQKSAQTNADYARAMGLYGLGQAAGRDIGSPTAVQVRLSNADRL